MSASLASFIGFVVRVMQIFWLKDKSNSAMTKPYSLGKLHGFTPRYLLGKREHSWFTGLKLTGLRRRWPTMMLTSSKTFLRQNWRLCSRRRGWWRRCRSCRYPGGRMGRFTAASPQWWSPSGTGDSTDNNSATLQLTRTSSIPSVWADFSQKTNRFSSLVTKPLRKFRTFFLIL